MNPARFAAGALLAVAFPSAASAQAEYLAYAVDDGSRRPLPESIDAIDAHDLLEVQWQYRGGRSPVLVLPVTDAGGRRSESGYEAGQAGATMPGEGAPLAAVNKGVYEIVKAVGRLPVSGRVVKAEVEERFSIAEVLSATKTPDRGDRVRSAPVPTGFAFGPAWETTGE